MPRQFNFQKLRRAGLRRNQIAVSNTRTQPRPELNPRWFSTRPVCKIAQPANVKTNHPIGLASNTPRVGSDLSEHIASGAPTKVQAALSSGHATR